MFSRVAFRASETRPKKLDDEKLLQITLFRLANGKRPQYTVPVNSIVKNIEKLVLIMML